ncbi:MAG: hypothetical protein WD042_03170 [Phycisphaeraceae bacterium]
MVQSLAMQELPHSSRQAFEPLRGVDAQGVKRGGYARAFQRRNGRAGLDTMG